MTHTPAFEDECKRCGCNASNPCIQRIGQQSQPCAWAMSGLCTNCLTPDEQQLVVTLSEQFSNGPMNLVDAKAAAREELFMRLLPELAGGLLSMSSMSIQTVSNRRDDIVSLALELAEEGAAALYPDTVTVDRAIIISKEATGDFGL